MLRIIGIILTTIVTSFYFFPFEFKFLPGMNTKMIMAGLALVILPFQKVKTSDQNIPKWMLNLSLWAIAVSLFGLFAVIYNHTNDMTYASYIVSMWVWLGGAYVVVTLMRTVHNEIDVKTLIYYLIAVCAAQCLIAWFVENYVNVKNFVDSIVAGEGFMGVNESRLYGIGASLDVAGMRFSSVLVMIAILFSEKFYSKTSSLFSIIIISVCFIIIAIIGNMISRTTTIGVIVAFVTYIITSRIYNKNKSINIRYLSALIIIIMTGVLGSVILYNTHEGFHSNIRFAFEGFFSLAETGEWNVSSNKILENMWVLPESLKTWIIGDGYFDNPYNNDPYYVGPKMGGYYMTTDIGYLRFIFYFGIFGTLSFIIFFWQTAKYCIQKYWNYRVMFFMILMLNYIIWFKVASDLFSVFALFLVLPAHNELQNNLKKETSSSLPTI